MEIKLWKIKYRLKKKNINKWEEYYCNVVSVDIEHIKHWFTDMYGENNFLIISWDDKGIIHGIDNQVIENIMNLNINAVLERITGNIDDKLYQLHHLKTQISRGKKDWYGIDKVINDGKEKQKEIIADSKKKDVKGIWNKMEYENE